MNWNRLSHILRYSFRHHRVRIGGYFLFALILSTAIITLGIWLPVNQKYNAAWNKNQGIQEDIRAFNKQQLLAKSYRKNIVYVNDINRKLKLNNSQATVVSDISQLAIRNNITIEAESYDEGVTESGYSSLNHSLVLTGSYSSVRNFMSDIEQLAAWAVIKEARFKKMDNGLKQVTVNLKLSIYKRARLN